MKLESIRSIFAETRTDIQQLISKITPTSAGGGGLREGKIGTLQEEIRRREKWSKEEMKGERSRGVYPQQPWRYPPFSRLPLFYCHAPANNFWTLYRPTQFYACFH